MQALGCQRNGKRHDTKDLLGADHPRKIMVLSIPLRASLVATRSPRCKDEVNMINWQ